MLTNLKSVSPQIPLCDSWCLDIHLNRAAPPPFWAHNSVWISAASASKHLFKLNLDGSDLSNIRAILAFPVVLVGWTHAVPATLSAHDVIESLLSNEVTLVDDQLTYASRPNLHHVEPPTVSSGCWALGNTTSRATRAKRHWLCEPQGNSNQCQTHGLSELRLHHHELVRKTLRR